MKFKIETTNELITNETGLVLVGQLLNSLNIGNRVNHIQGCLTAQPEIPNEDIIKSYIGMTCVGYTHFDDIERFRNDMVFKNALEIKTVPSSSSLRTRLNGLEEEIEDILRMINGFFLRGCTITPIEINGEKFIPIDIDVSVLDNSKSKKEGVDFTYKKVEGYSPVFAYIGEEGYMLNCQLREGQRHSQYNTPEFLRTTLEMAKSLDLPYDIIVRMDSGFDSNDNLAICEKLGIMYLIKRNPRKETGEKWLEIAEENYLEHNETRPGKDVYTGSVYKDIDGNDEDGKSKTRRIVFEVTKRTIEANGQLLLTPDIEFDTYWAPACFTEKQIIELYHKHGTSEQFHSELKSDMDVEKLPSGKFKTNSFCLLLAMISYNILRRIGQDYWTLANKIGKVKNKANVFRRRIRNVLLDVIKIAAKFVKGGRKLYKIKLCKHYSVFYSIFGRLYAVYAAL